MTPEPHALTLVGAIEALSSRTLSCTALTQSLLDRIDATDANVQAWAWLDRQQALAAARALDARRTSGGESRLEGVPIGVKDIIATAGDAVLTPPAPGPAPQDLTQTGDAACCSLWSLAGFPSLTLPIALAPNGLPLGMQLAAPALHDQRLVAVGKWCELRLPFHGLI
jgi:Asp-tRNA(Asn)/Glu-tRNA(Gln) amidotransferase A subunit family amidase